MKIYLLTKDSVREEFNDVKRNFTYDLPDGKPGLCVHVEGKEKEDKDFMFLVSSPTFYSNQQRRIYLATVSRQTGNLKREFHVVRKIYKFYKESTNPKELEAISKEARSIFQRFANLLPKKTSLDKIENEIENMIQNQKYWKIAQ